MARGRMLNRKVSLSEKVAALGDKHGPWAVVFHHRIISHLDINGNCRADPHWLKAEIFPLVDVIGPDDCRTFAAALEELGLAELYEVGRMPYLHFPGFADEQPGLRRDKEKPQVPAPQEGRAVAGKKAGNVRAVGGQQPDNSPGQVEVEVEVEGTTTTEAIASGAEPRESKAPPPAVLRPSDPVARTLRVVTGAAEPERTRHDYRSEAAALIREHLWQGKDPPKDWTMARDLSIWDALADHHGAEAVNGAIGVARRTLGFKRREPLTMKIFNVKGRRDQLQVCLAAWRKAEMQNAAVRLGGAGG